MNRKEYQIDLGVELGFKLNMQIIADALDEKFQILEESLKNDDMKLTGVRFYRGKQFPQKKFVHLVMANRVTPEFTQYDGIDFVVIGDCDLHMFGPGSSVVVLKDGTDILDVLDYCLRVFSHFASWDMTLQTALNSEKPLDGMLEATMRLMQNPIFIHDVDFYILACPAQVEGMTRWEKDVKTGRDMVPYQVINDFKVDQEYQNTLKTRRADIFSKSQRGYRILYMNLWNESHYEGRICVDELQSVISHGDYYAIEYLARLVMISSNRRNLFWMNLGRNMEEFLKSVLDGQMNDQQKMQDMLRFQGWDIADRYLCLKMVTDQRDFETLSPVSTLGYIEMHVAASQAFFYDNSIVVVANLSKGEHSVKQAVSNLAIVLREGLFKMGVSSEQSKFWELRKSYEQASIALEYGGKSGSMIWCHRFEEYAMKYMIENWRASMPPEFLCARQILDIQKYDEEHETNLNETLKVYLNLERNVVQTAKKLDIHRSTLFYRLDRIHKLVDLDLDDNRMRCFLRLSYLLRE